MGKAMDAKSSRVQYDGGMPVIVQSGQMTVHTAQSGLIKWVAPFDYVIKQALIKVDEASGTAPGLVKAGTVADDDRFIDDYSVATDAAVGLVDVTSSLVNTSGVAGDVIIFGNDGAATTTGLAHVILVIVPASAE
jgi:hypothetical protein